MVSKPDPHFGIEMSSKDIDSIKKITALIRHFAVAELPQKMGLEMFNRYTKDHPEDSEPRDIGIGTCAVLQVTMMLKSLVEALENAKPNG